MAEYSRLTVQLPPELHDRMSAAAKAARRSLSAEAVFRLEQTFALEQRVVFDPDFDKRPMSELRPGVTYTNVPQEGDSSDESYEPFEDPA